MNRRDMLLLPGAALAAGTALAQTATPEPVPVRTSHRSLISANLGLSKAQLLNIAANANLQFLQILSADQQARLAQFQG